MLSPSDFNNAVPQFTNGNYASNPLNPQYIAEPSSTDYNRGVEPIQTLPAQWWNWFMNKFTTRFNKVNVYVKNIFNELSQLLSLVSETPSGTEATPTVGQLKDMFETKYPDYLKTAPALSNTYVPQTTTVNGQALSCNVSICCVACAGANGSGTAFGSAATLNKRAGASDVTYVEYSGANGCCLLAGDFLAYWDGSYNSSGCSNLKYFHMGAFGSAAHCSASCFRPITWTPTCVCCAGRDGNGCSFGTAARCSATAFRSCTWLPSCVACAGCADNATRASYTYNHCRSISYTGCSTCNTCNVCIWLSSTSSNILCIANNRDSPIMYYASHNTGTACTKTTGILAPGYSAGLGACWNCCSANYKCVYVYLFN